MTATDVQRDTLYDIVATATRAPSVHNTQPWLWRGTSHGLELHADRSRQLPAGDPDGRNLVLSCGSALHHAQVAADALGWASRVDRLPDADQPDLLARITLSPRPPSAQAGDLRDAIGRRFTDRRRFTSWPVPDERLTHLAAEASAWQARALPLTDVPGRFRTELLINRAVETQSGDEPVIREQEQWVDHGTGDGVPSAVLPGPAELSPRRPSRFVTGLLDDIGGREVEASDGLIIMCGHDDDPETWLRTGEGLSALWLAATREGLSVVPLSQVVEVPQTREALRLEVLGGLATPLIVVRVGWQAIARRALPATPRRPVDDVLVLG
jgi:nitroreductase